MEGGQQEEVLEDAAGDPRTLSMQLCSAGCLHVQCSEKGHRSVCTLPPKSTAVDRVLQIAKPYRGVCLVSKQQAASMVFRMWKDIHLGICRTLLPEDEQEDVELEEEGGIVDCVQQAGSLAQCAHVGTYVCIGAYV